METEPKPRTDQAVPHPDTSALSEAEKRALELSGEIEHQHGAQREATAHKAEASAQPS